MARYVVDASVAVKWLIDEEHGREAETLLRGDDDLLTPSLLVVEVTNVVWKKVGRGDMNSDQASELVRQIARFPVTRIEQETLIEQALVIAIEHGRSVYDSLYVALALRENCPLVTADRRLYNAIHPALPEAVLWVGDLAVEV